MLKYASGRWSERLDSRLVIIPRPCENYSTVITQSYKLCLTTYLNSLSKRETVSNLKVRPVYYHSRKTSIVYQISHFFQFNLSLKISLTNPNQNWICKSQPSTNNNPHIHQISHLQNPVIIDLFQQIICRYLINNINMMSLLTNTNSVV